MEINQTMRLYMFEDMMEKATGLSCWRYDAQMNLTSSTRSDPALMDDFFSTSGCKQAVFNLFKTSQMPVQISDHLNLHWLAVPYFQENVLTQVFLMGPCLLSYTTEQTLLNSLQGMKLSSAYKQPLIQQLNQLPIIPHSTLMSYGRLLYFCLTEQNIEEADIFIYVLRNHQQEDNTDELINKHRSRDEITFEHLYFSAIAQGNINFKAPPFYDPSQIGLLSKDTPLRHTKNQMIVKITLATRAAIHGGLPEEIAFALSDQYILMVEDCSSAEGAYEVGNICYKDMLERVHKLNQQSEQGREMQQCYAYIESRLTDRIDYKEMADTLGYNRQYLSAKFKKGTGKTLSQFITEKRVEYAKVLLRTSDRSILEISQILQFSSCSYFGAAFRKYVGMSPSDYRNKAVLPEGLEW